MEQIFDIFFDAVAGGTEILSLLLLNNYWRCQINTNNKIKSYVSCSNVELSTSTITITMEAICINLINGSER